MGMIIRPFEKSDYKQWLPLWNANGHNQVTQDVTNQTWQRLCDPNAPVNGYGAFIDGQLAGIMHYILHPITGDLNPACYMQDLYTAEDMRRKGIARALVERLGLEGKDQGWARIYWLAEANNEPVQNLYKTLGIKLNFTFHVLP